MNKNCVYGILLFQSIIFSLYPLDGYAVNYTNVKDEHKVHIETSIRSICAINCAIFSHQSIDVSVTPLLGGRSGDGLYVIEAHPYRYVLRCMKQPHSPEVCHKECMYSDVAAQKGMGPKVLYHNEEAGCYATEFVEGIQVSSAHLENECLLERFADDLRALHNVVIGSHMEFDIFEHLEQKIESSMQKNPEFLVELRDCLDALLHIKTTIKKHAIELKTCHNDIHALNLLYTPKDTIQFIDWGNAGLSDPFYDLACSSVKLQFSNGQRNFFLEKYFQNNVSSCDRAHFVLMEDVVLWDLWLSFLDMKHEVFSELLTTAVLNYFHKIDKEVTETPHTGEDLAVMMFAFIQKRAQSQEYRQALMVLDQL